MKLYNGDCLEVMKNIPDNSVDLTVTSPPYDNLRTYNGNNDQWSEQVWKDCIQELFRVTKQGGVVVWVVADATIKGSETGTSFKQALWAKECGFNLHDTMIWNKGTFTAVGSLVSRYAPVFEYMFILSKGYPKTFNPIKDRENKYGGQYKKASTIRTAKGFRMMSGDKTIAKMGQRHNVWDLSPEMSNKNRKHPAPFPEKLAEDHILSWSNEGDTVLDPMAGSGTTLKMAKKNNRKYIGIEISEEYIDIINKRLALPE